MLFPRAKCLWLAVGVSAVISAATTVPAYSQGVGSAKDKLVVRKDWYNIKVPEIRAVRTNDVLSVQADFFNDGVVNKYVYYRFRWLDSAGNQVGDGEVWKQVTVLGDAQETVKGVAPSSKVEDFKIEMNIQAK